MSSKKHKVVVVGLPKTGTSTLAVMLRMINYSYTGPEIDFHYQDGEYLENKFEKYDAFQDYPWCFEWPRFADVENVKFIILSRDFESWWKSFYESYGRKKENYLAFPYMKISKIMENKDKFKHYFNSYYQNADSFAIRYPKKTLNINIKTFEWQELCEFLGEKPPKTIIGSAAKKPHVNKKNSKTKRTLKFKILKSFKNGLITLLGLKTYLRLVTFLRINNMI